MFSAHHLTFGVILSLHGGYSLALACVNSPQFFRTQKYFALCATIKFIFSTTVLRQPSQATPLNIPRYRKAVTSALWVQVTMTFCYLPYRIVEILRPQIRLSSSLYLSIQFTANLVLFKNSSLNPLLDCWKIREVRQAVEDTIRQFFCAQN